MQILMWKLSYMSAITHIKSIEGENWFFYLKSLKEAIREEKILLKKIDELKKEKFRIIEPIKYKTSL